MIYFASEKKYFVDIRMHILRVFPPVFVREEPPLLGSVHVRPQGPFSVGRCLSFQRSQLDLVQTKLEARTFFVQGNVFAVHLQKKIFGWGWCVWFLLKIELGFY